MGKKNILKASRKNKLLISRYFIFKLNRKLKCVPSRIFHKVIPPMIVKQHIQE